MAGTPIFKVYREAEYVAACKYAEDAAVLAAVFGVGTTIRVGHTFIAWREGAEEISAAESYDRVARVISDRRSAATPRLSRNQAEEPSR